MIERVSGSEEKILEALGAVSKRLDAHDAHIARLTSEPKIETPHMDLTMRLSASAEWV